MVKNEDHKLVGEPLQRDWELMRSLKERMGCNDEEALLAVENLVHLLRTHKIIYEALAVRLQQWDLCPAHYNFLVVLYKAPQHQMQMSEIGELMNVTVSPSNVTKLADTLERRGLIHRKPSSLDRRVVLAELTEEGFRLVQSLAPEHYRWIRALWGDLSLEEKRYLTHLLLKLRGNVQSALAGEEATNTIRTELEE